MDQKKLEALVKLILADPRINAVIKNGPKESSELVIIEKKDCYPQIPLERRSAVFCQEEVNGGDGFIGESDLRGQEWTKISVYQPSLNLIAKAASGIADEPILEFLQEKLAAGCTLIFFEQLFSVTSIPSVVYRSVFEKYLQTLCSFGISIPMEWKKEKTTEEGCGFQEVKNERNNLKEQSVSDAVWNYRALTERDLLDMDRGTVLRIGRKCIVTSLAVEMADKRSIRIHREGERV